MTLDDLSLMRREEVLQACRLSKSTMYHLIEQGVVSRACADRPQVRTLAEVGRGDLADCAAPGVGSGIPCVSGVNAVIALLICQ